MSISLSNFFPNNGIGNSNQTITNVTGSRSAGVTYTNSTSSPIFVWVVNTYTANANIYFSVNGNIVSISAVGNGQSINGTVGGIVKVGSTYSITTTSTAISQWYELR